MVVSATVAKGAVAKAKGATPAPAAKAPPAKAPTLIPNFVEPSHSPHATTQPAQGQPPSVGSVLGYPTNANPNAPNMRRVQG